MRELHNVCHGYSYTMANPGSLCMESNLDQNQNMNLFHTYSRDRISKHDGGIFAGDLE